MQQTGMKLTLRFEEHESKDLHLTLRITLPKKYASGPTKDVVKLFVDAYNKKHSETNPLDAETLHLKMVGGNHLERDAKVDDFLASGDECYLLGGEVLKGPAPPAKRAASSSTAAPAAAKPAAASTVSATESEKKPGMLRCKRFGCQHKYYDPAGPPQECVHHKSAPIFHETAKWWSCCPDKKAYEFDEFMRIPGCMTSFCSNCPDGQDGKRFLGGSDLRGDNAPVRLDADAPKDPRHQVDDLRKGLLAIGVDGELFEKVWAKLAGECNGDMEKVADLFRSRFGKALGSLST